MRVLVVPLLVAFSACSSQVRSPNLYEAVLLNIEDRLDLADGSLVHPGIILADTLHGPAPGFRLTDYATLSQDSVRAAIAATALAACQPGTRGLCEAPNTDEWSFIVVSYPIMRSSSEGIVWASQLRFDVEGYSAQYLRLIVGRNERGWAVTDFEYAGSEN